MRTTRLALSLAVVAGVSAAVPAAMGAQAADVVAAAAPCLDQGIPGTFEEQLVDRAQPITLIQQAGLAGQEPSFAKELCATTSVAGAKRVISSRASALWSIAVKRAQGTIRSGLLSAGDDRPLYWTRLQLTRDVRRFAPSFAITAAERDAMIVDLDRRSRGQDDLRFSARRAGVKRVLISGFDPFQLTSNIDNGNPSGAGALSLDGRTLRTAKGLVEFQAFLLPVRWADFERGDQERALRPLLKQVDMFATISQGRPGQFDLEVTNGAWRAGDWDNLHSCYTGRIPIAAGTPTVTPQPEWTGSTLPFTAMAAVKGDYFMNVNHNVTVIPAPTPVLPPITECATGVQSLVTGAGVDKADGPAPTDSARGGGGGAYLSNESAYRATLLRDALGLKKLPGGHIHTPVLDGIEANSRQVSNANYEGRRDAIVAQLQRILLAGAASL